MQFRAVGPLADAGEDLSDATVQFRAVGRRPAAAEDLSDATVQFRAVGRRPAAAEDLSDATVQFRAVGRRPAAAEDLSDATVQFRAVGRPPAAAEDLSDATVQFQVISQLADPITPFRVIGQPAYISGHVHGDQGQAELRSLIHSVLAGLTPREREVIELSFRHDLNDNDLAIVLGLSQSRAHDLASRARGRLEEALGALHIALTGREACPVLGELLADWDGQLTEETRNLVVWHIGECKTCAQHGWGAMRPAAFSRLLPLAPLPQELREQVLSLCTSTAEDAVAYRRRVVRRAERIWFARFSLAIRQVSWSGIRANPGMAIAAAAVAVWVVAAVSVTMLTFAGPHAAGGPDNWLPRRTCPGDPDERRDLLEGSCCGHGDRPRIPARPSPTVTQPPAYVPTPVQTVPSRVAATSPAPSRSTSSSSQPSKSPKPSRSGSPHRRVRHPRPPRHPRRRHPAGDLGPSLTFLDKLIFAVFALVSMGVWAGLRITHVSAWERSGRARRS